MNLRQLAEALKKAAFRAAQTDDIDQALSSVMELLGQDAGDVAGQMFSSTEEGDPFNADEWPHLSPRERLPAIREWMKHEVMEALEPIGVSFPGNAVHFESAEEEYDPYTDPEAMRILERAGIATYKHRR